MRNNRCLVTLILLLFSSAPLIAQKTAHSGYYISTSGDSVRGIFPVYEEWSRNPVRVKFVPASGSEIILTPDNTRRFVVDGGDEYLSYSGMRMVNPITDVVVLSEPHAISMENVYDTVNTFLRLVTRTSQAHLYQLNDAKRINFFYLVPGQGITELKYKKTIDADQLREHPDYRQQLNIAFGEAINERNLMPRLEKLRYHERDLSTFFQKMFPGTSEGTRVQDRPSHWVLSAGLGLNNIKEKTEFNLEPRPYNTSITPVISIGTVIPVSRNSGRYFLYPQARLFRYKNEAEVRNNGITSTYYYKATILTIEMAGGMNMVNTEDLKVFAYGGVGSMLQLGGKAGKVSQSGSYEDNLPRLRYVSGLTIGASVRDIELSTTYLLPSVLVRYAYVPSLSGVQFRVGFKL